MQIHQTKRLRLSEDLGYNSEYDNEAYRYWINFYTNPPTGKITMQETENCIAERMQILSTIDSIYKTIEKDGARVNQTFYKVLVSNVQMVKAPNGDNNFYVAGRSHKLVLPVIQARRRDHISHFLLRLYYCQNDQLRRWFIRLETDLFRLRFMDSEMDPQNYKLTECLAFYGYHYKVIDEEERASLQKYLDWEKHFSVKHDLQPIFKLRFEDAADLVRWKRVFLKDGFAYIHADNMTSVLCAQFRNFLSRALTRMHQLFYRLDEDRLLARLDALHKQFITDKQSAPRGQANKNHILAEDIDKLAIEAFPPCMRSIHEKLRRDHHLKHYGRLHYGLFLRSAGLPLDEAMTFFRAEFSQISAEKFQKEYAYNIRYNYGKEGKRVAISAYGCHKILNDNQPGPGDSHGCPFKHFDASNLKAMLVRYGVNKEEDIEEIMKQVTNDRNYQSACTRFFSIKMEGATPTQGAIYHPNQFLSEVQKLKASKLELPEEVMEVSEAAEKAAVNDKQNNIEADIESCNQI